MQAFPSLHGPVLFTCLQPLTASQESSVHTLPSSQLGGGPPAQCPPEQMSLVVQASPSLHGLALFTCTQPEDGLHESSVQTLLSSQFSGTPGTQLPPVQTSFVVHALPSLHGFVLLMCTQMSPWQSSVVQTLPSSHADEDAHSTQPGIGVPWQVPLMHTSLLVQGCPSPQEFELLVWVQPDAGLQESSVHTFPSSQFGAGPGTQAPPWHVSVVVQALPSLQGNELSAWRHPTAESQKSSVHTLLSLQLGAGPGMQLPPEQVSFVVQALPSLHGLVLLACMQPPAGSHESSVQTFPSSQFSGEPGTQLPPEQASLVVQALLSLQGLVLLTCTQPLAGLQESSVHPFPSSQFGGGPGMQLPPAHVSFVVHASPSLHGLVLLTCVQPVAGSQASSVQMLPSSQFGAGPGTQFPPEHVSFVVQALPSLHGLLLFV